MINTIQKNPKKIFTLTEKQLESALKEADDFYYNSKKTILEDHIYDLAKERLQLEFPENPFHKSVGAPIKKGDKFKLPYWLGSMDKIKPELNNLNGWMKKYNGDESVYLEPMSVGLNVTDLSNPLDCKVISETERTNFQFLYDNLVKLTLTSNNEPQQLIDISENKSSIIKLSSEMI